MYQQTKSGMFNYNTELVPLIKLLFTSMKADMLILVFSIRDALILIIPADPDTHYKLNQSRSFALHGGLLILIQKIYMYIIKYTRIIIGLLHS